MATLLIILLILMLSLGTLLFLIGYGALFFGAFSHNNRISILLLILLGFSSVIMVMVGLAWYYALPFWLIPPFYALFALPAGQVKKRATQAFFVGLFLFIAGVSILAYIATKNADIRATLEQLKTSQTTEQSQ